MPPDSGRVFLCHNSRDKPAVRRLRELLDANGIETWIDECELGAGTGWQGDLGQALIAAPAVIICFGPHNTGPWQDDEIALIVQERKKTDATVIPLILPSCGDIEPEIPLFLRLFQCIDLRLDEIEADPFGRLLSAIDSREAIGHHRPTVLTMGRLDDASSDEARQRVTSYCHDVLHRVRHIDPTGALFEQSLMSALDNADVLVTTLSLDSFDAFGDFDNGVAPAACQFATQAGVEVIQWRAENLKIPTAGPLADSFRSTDIETCLTFQLAQHVTQTAQSHFAERQHAAVQDPPAVGEAADRKRTVLGFPRNGKPFARQIAGELKDSQIRCDSLGEWDRVATRLKKDHSAYDALVVILNGDDDWLDECSAWLDEMEINSVDALPPIGAYCHKSEDDLDADPVPFDLEQFQEYFGRKDLQKLADRISNGGDA